MCGDYYSDVVFYGVSNSGCYGSVTSGFNQSFFFHFRVHSIGGSASRVEGRARGNAERLLANSSGRFRG